MLKYFMIGMMSLSFCFGSSHKTVLKTSRGSKIMTSDSQCRVLKSSKQATQDSCACCVIKKTPKQFRALDDHNPRKKTMAADIMRKCVAKKQCRPEQLANGFDQIKTILRENVAIQFISVDQKDLEKDFSLTTNGVVELLSRIYQSSDVPQSVQQKLKGLLDNKASIRVKKSEEGGSKTAQLFLIFSGDTLAFILKGMKNPFEEVNNLRRVEESALKKYFLHQGEGGQGRRDPLKPSIAMDVYNVMYSPPKGAVHYMSLIQAAQGSAIKKIIETYIERHSPEDIKKTRKALKELGRAIATIHRENQVDPKKVMTKTIVHGDFHPDNVFYGDKITFIDNETFAYSLKKKQDPTVDVMKFYGTLVASFNVIHDYLNRMKKKGIDEQSFYRDVVQPFVEGYVDAYPPLHRQEVFNKLKAVMSKQGVIETFMKNKISTFNPVKLHQSQQKYLPAVFEAVGKKMNAGKGHKVLKGK